MSHSDSPSIVYETTIDALVTEAWALLSDFGGWAKWCPMFKNMRIINGKTGVNSIRKYTTITESSYEEVLRELDNEKHTFHYDFIALHPSQPGLNGITHRVAMVPVVNKETQEATLTKITWSAWIETAGIPDQLRLGILSKQRMAYEKISETLHVRILAEKIMKIGMEFFNDKVMAMTRALLIKQGDLWEYDQYDDSLGFLPRMIKGLPTSEALPPQRMADMLARFLEIAYLQVGELVAATNNPQSQPQQETDEIDYAKGNLAIIDYGKIQAPGLKTVLNHMLENWTDDVEFCQQLLQGANPLHIKMVKDFAEVPDCLNGLSVTDPSGKKKSVKDLVHEKRLFILDYREFVKFDIIPPAYFSAPVMLVYREIIDEYTSRLNVLGIQLHPHHKEIYTPDMPQKNRYKLAKMFVANADCQLHEFRYHLGIAHMGMEPIAVAVHNRFKDTHPVRVLLTPHLEGTIGITFLARQTLIAEKEAFTDKTFAIGTKQGIRLVSDGWRSYDFFKSSFPEQLEARGFDEAGTDGVKDYLYRDDGFKLWNAIGAYTTDFVNKFYPTDADVAKDGDIQRWADEMSSKDAAYIPGFPNLIENKKSLAHILQIIIWNGSAQHSVVNNPQYPYASFVPNRPNIIFRPMPELPEDGSDIDADYLKAAMSPQIMVMFQLTLSWILSLPSDSNLTDLRALKNIYPEGDAKFQAILSKVATDIKARNQALEAAGKAPYIFLLPENVACSVNI